MRLLHPVPEACDILGGISRSSFYSLVAGGEIETVKVGARTFVTDGALAAFVDRLSATDDGEVTE